MFPFAIGFTCLVLGFALGALVVFFILGAVETVSDET
jgi:hypothetical protein